MADATAVEPDIPQLPVAHGFELVQSGRGPVFVAEPPQAKGQFAKQVADCSGRPLLAVGSQMRRNTHRLLHVLLISAPRFGV